MRERFERDYQIDDQYGSISQQRDAEDSINRDEDRHREFGSERQYRSNSGQEYRGPTSSSNRGRFEQSYGGDPRAAERGYGPPRFGQGEFGSRSRQNSYGWDNPTRTREERPGNRDAYSGSGRDPNFGGRSAWEVSGGGRGWQSHLDERLRDPSFGSNTSGGGYVPNQNERWTERSGGDFSTRERDPFQQPRREGGFFGKGPKGYNRSDERIREDVCDRLSDDDDVDASDISVSVKDGEVTLSGSVENRHAKHRAEDIADSVSGVKDVHIQLKTRRGFLQEVGDRLSGRDEQEQHGHTGSGTRNSPASNVANTARTHS